MLPVPYTLMASLPPDASYVLNVYRAAHFDGQSPPMPSEVAEACGWGRKRMMAAVTVLRENGLMDGYTPL
jgi:hypothetical protein